MNNGFVGIKQWLWQIIEYAAWGIVIACVLVCIFYAFVVYQQAKNQRGSSKIINQALIRIGFSFVFGVIVAQGALTLGEVNEDNTEKAEKYQGNPFLDQ